MLVQVAVKLGRHVVDVAADPFVLTLWTFWHIQQIQEVEAHEKHADRLDLAGLVAVSYHDPKELTNLRANFLSALKTGYRGNTMTPERVQALLDDHKKLVQISPEDANLPQKS